MIQKFPITVRPSNLSNTKITIYGEWFKYITGYGIYLSANKPELNTQLVDLYTENYKLYSKNPFFHGIPVTKYKIIDNNILEFYLPEDLISANYDIIICNPAGYVKATTQLSLNVLKVVGVFDFKTFKNISGTNTITSIQDSNILTVRPSFVYDYSYANNVTLSNENVIFSINGDNIYTIGRFLATN